MRGAVQSPHKRRGAAVTAGVTVASHGRDAAPLNWLRKAQPTPPCWRQQMRDLSTFSHASLVPLVAVLALILACAPDAGPTGMNGRLSASRDGVPFSEGLASPGWQETARNLVVQARLGPIPAGHAYPLLGVAQYLAVQRAEAAADVGGRALLETDRGAVAGASVVVLSYLFPGQK